jgi:hypothetical protein
MRERKTIDTLYPEHYYPSFLEFEQRHLLGIEVKTEESADYEYCFAHNKWLAKRYPFKTSHIAISQGYSAVGIQWRLGNGCYLITNCMDPEKAETEVEINSHKHLYLVLLYRHKDLWDGSPCLPKVKKFIKYLEAMPGNPIETIYTRAHDVGGYDMRHLRLTGMIKDVNATTSRLKSVYARYFGAKIWKYNDYEGKPFLKFDYNPKYPLYT